MSTEHLGPLSNCTVLGKQVRIVIPMYTCMGSSDTHKMCGLSLLRTHVERHQGTAAAEHAEMSREDMPAGDVRTVLPLSHQLRLRLAMLNAVDMEVSTQTDTFLR